MARKTVTINDGSGEREQVTLNLNPLALTPTINQGGNYRVAVQATPKTNAATQLASALRTGVQVYGQGVKVAQAKAARDIAEMDDATFESKVQEGLDKEGRSLFGYEKAYNEALSSRYYSEVIPKKLQDLSTRLLQDPYEYTSLDEFDTALEAGLNEVYAEAGEKFGRNVFASRANRALRQVTQDDFMLKQRNAFIQRMPEITVKTRSDATFQAIEAIEDFTKVSEVLNSTHAATASITDKKRAGDITTSSYFASIERAIASKNFARAEQLIDELDDGKIQVNGVELFNTATAQTKLADLESNLLEAQVNHAKLQEVAGKQALMKIQNDVIAALGTGEPDEAAGFELLNKFLEEYQKNQTVTVDGKSYDDDTALNVMLTGIRSMQNNPTYFQAMYRTNFLQTHSSAKDRITTELTDAASLESLGAESLVTQGFNSAGNSYFTYSEEGLRFVSAFKTNMEQLKIDLYNSTAGLDPAERIERYIADYDSMVLQPMEKFRDSYIKRATPATNSTEISKRIQIAALVSKNERDLLIQAHGHLLGNQLADATALARYDEERDELLGDNDLLDSVENNGVIRKSAKGIKEDFVRASSQSLFTSAGEKIKNWDAMYAHYNKPLGAVGRNYTPKYIDFLGYSKNEIHRSVPATEKLTRRQGMIENLSIYGVTADELIKDQFSGTQKLVSVSDVFAITPKSEIQFDRFPIIIGDSMNTTVELVQKYVDTPEEDFSMDAMPESIFKMLAIADKHGVSIDELMNAQHKYLTKNNYIDPKQTETE